MANFLGALGEPSWPGREGAWGGMAPDNRRFLNALFWTFRVGARGRDWPPADGAWKHTHRRCRRWPAKGSWEARREPLVEAPDFAWRMSEARHVKVPPHASGAPGGNQDRSDTKGGRNTKRDLAGEAQAMPVRVLVTPATTADGTQAGRLLAGLSAVSLWADRRYDRDALLAQTSNQGRRPVMPPKKKGKGLREYDKQRCQLRQRIENAFLPRKRGHGIAPRYAPNSASFLAAAHLRGLVRWLNIS
jgi:transposase